MTHDDQKSGFKGPKCWVVSIVAGLILGFVLGKVFDIEQADTAPTGGELVRIVQIKGGAEETIWTAPGSSAMPGNGTQIVSADGDLPIALSQHGSPDHHDDGHAPEKGHHGGHNGHADHGEHGEHDDHAAHGDHGHGEHAGGHGAHGPEAKIPVWLLLPFALMLLSIAVMPFINEHFWHEHFPDFAFFLGAVVLAFYMFGPLGWDYAHGMSYGAYKMYHVGLEYFAFIALIGGLYVASGGLYIDVRAEGRPMVNTMLLAFGAIIANIVGTTGASVLLIRPFMRINRGRIRPIHIVMFIFIVSNCGGALTPIGDPPLYLGFLRGVPFQWTLIHLWPMWLVCIGSLLAIYYFIDSRIKHKGEIDSVEEVILVNGNGNGNGAGEKSGGISIRGTSAMIALTLIVAGVFIDPILKVLVEQKGMTGLAVFQHKLGPAFQILVALVAFKIADRKIHTSNDFNFFPVKEVGFLFVGIFTTMAPALAYLEANAGKFGLDSPSLFYFGTGTLSACLDNAPTYLNFLQAAFGMLHMPLDAVHLTDQFLVSDYQLEYADGTEPVSLNGSSVLAAISLGAVFFGAMTYIGNGPNFMVKSIAEASGIRMPSFFGYLMYSMVLLLPVLLLIWFIFLR